MGRFAWRNLLTRPVRTALALTGLSIPILGVMGLFSLSGGLRNMVGDTLSQVQGVMVIRENMQSPVLSDLPADMAEKIAKVPGVRAVAPEIWKIAPSIDGKGFVQNLASKGFGGLIGSPVIQGQDIDAHAKLKSAVYPRALREHGEGRFLGDRDKGQPTVVISKKLAVDFGDPKTKTPKKVGDKLKIGHKEFTIIGLYDTGSLLLDTVMVMEINTARSAVQVAADRVSTFYVEAADPNDNDRVSAEIKKALDHQVEARSMNQFLSNFNAMMSQVDKLMLMVVSLALLVGVVGIINTMLMSTSERYVEFGVLRTNGWSRANVLSLVTLESAYLGLLSGVVGCVLALAGVAAVNQVTSEGVQLTMPLWLLGLGVGLSVATGTLGGLYPAWRAAGLVPMDAIRAGSH
jgi:putative ABC transport system permease protein